MDYIQEIQTQLETIKTLWMEAVNNELVDTYEFWLLMLSLHANEYEETVMNKIEALEKSKTKKIDEILAEYNLNPETVKSTGEIKPLSEEAIKRKLRQIYVDQDYESNVEKNHSAKLQKDIKAYIRRGERMGSKLIQRNVDDKRNREQGLIQ